MFLRNDTRGLGRWGRRAVAVLAVGGVAACDLNVADPEIVQPGQLTDVNALPTLRAGAIGDFAAAYSGVPGTEGIILVAGLRADEWLNRDTFGTRREIDLGTIQDDNASNQQTFRDLHRARRAAELAADRFEALAPGEPGHSEVLSLAGFATLMLGENYCTGIPFSTLTEQGVFEFGEALGTQQVFERALAQFDEALAIAEELEDDRLINLARVGRGRALLDLARFAEAAAAVADVPDDFSYDVEYSENTEAQNNAVFVFNNINRRWGVANNEGGNGLPFVTAGDPRVPTEASDRLGLDNVGNLFNQLKYPTRDASIPLATGVEARLIEIEAALNGAISGNPLAMLNALRADFELDPLTAINRDVLFEERAFFLFATAHRLGDMRRLLRAPYNVPFDQVYPTGQYFKGGLQYGTQANLPIPVDERNNPNFVACADPSS